MMSNYKANPRGQGFTNGGHALEPPTQTNMNFNGDYSVSPNTEDNSLEAIIMDDLATPRVSVRLFQIWRRCAAIFLDPSRVRGPRQGFRFSWELFPSLTGSETSQIVCTASQHPTTELRFGFGRCAEGLFEACGLCWNFPTLDMVINSDAVPSTTRSFDLEVTQNGLHVVTYAGGGGSLSAQQVLDLFRILSIRGYGQLFVGASDSDISKHQLWLIFRATIPMTRVLFENFAWICFTLNFFFDHRLFFWIGGVTYILGSVLINAISLCPMRSADPRVSGQCALNVYKRQARQLRYRTMPTWISLGSLVSMIQDADDLVETITITRVPYVWGTALHFEPGGTHPVRVRDLHAFLNVGKVPTPDGIVNVNSFTAIGGKQDFPLGMIAGVLVPFFFSAAVRLYNLAIMAHYTRNKTNMTSVDPTVDGQCSLYLWKPEFRKVAAEELYLDPSWYTVFNSDAYQNSKKNGQLSDLLWVGVRDDVWHLSPKKFEDSYMVTPDLLESFIRSCNADFQLVGRLGGHVYRYLFQMFWVSAAFYNATMSLCFANVFVALLLSACVSVWLMMQRSPLRIVFMTFGSRGDVIPIQYYVALLSRLGISVKLVDYSGMSGSDILKYSESGRYDQVIPHYLKFMVNIKDYINQGYIVFAPVMGYTHPRLISYAVSPLPGAIESFNLFDEDHPLRFINKISDVAYIINNPDIRIGSFDGCWPRSADGTSLISASPNRGTRKTLITLGSSALDEPTGYPYESTWSTNPNTSYQYEHRMNHAHVFSDYQTIVCHGGAGTVATAKACGCRVVSISKLLDRSVVENFPFVFSQDITCVHYDLMRLLPLNDAVTYMLATSPGRATCFRMMLILVRRCYVQMMVNVHTIVLMAYQLVTITGITRFDAQSYYQLFSGTLIGRYQAVLITVILQGIFTGLHRKKGLRWIWSWLRPYIAPFLLYYSDSMGTIAMVTAQEMFGYIGGIVVHYIVVDRACFSEIIFAQLKVIIASMCANAADWAVPTGPCVEVRFQPFQAYWLPWFIPAFHTDFVNPELGMAAGITCCDQLCRFYHQPSDDKRRVSFSLPTMIPLSRWADLCGQLAKADGESYNPLNHCQTNAFKALWNNGENSLAIIVLTFTCVIAIALLGIMGLFVVVPLLILNWFGCSWSQLALDEFTPAIAFAGLQPFQIRSMKDIFKFLFSPSTMMFEGPLMVLAPDQYPSVPVLNCSLLPSSARLMRLNIGGRGFDFWQPFIGMNRPNYKRARKPNYELIHSIDPASLHDTITDDQWRLVDIMYSQLPTNLPEDVAVVAISGERMFDEKHLKWLLKTFKMVIVLTNDEREIPGCVMVRLDATGRELAALRLAMPRTKGVYWYSFNSEYQFKAKLGPVKLWDIREIFKKSHRDFASVIPFGLHQCAAGIMIYRSCMYDRSDLNFEIYGSDEFAAVKKDGLVFCPIALMMMSLVRKEMNFPCKRRIHLYDDVSGAIRLQCDIENWNVKELLNAFATATTPNGKTIELDEQGFLVNGEVVNMAPIVSEMYPTGTPVEDVLVDIQANIGAFCHRVRKGAEGLMRDASTAPVSKDLISSYDSTLRAFQRGTRPPKALWAPIQKQLKSIRSEELGVVLHPNPVFVKSDFDTTLMHYVSQLNDGIRKTTNPKHRHEPLSPSKFRRRVNRNPYVDTYLQTALPESFGMGHDASSIACKEIMLASLARYNKSGFVDALIDEDVNKMVEVMFKRNPGMYENATIADPYRLTKRFLKFKKYSAGLPFTYEGSGIKSRADLRKAGMLRPIVDAALAPYITGKWYPALAHSFPKSQVIAVDKIVANPAKMRTVVATSGINNVQQGVFNFDLNNRHDFMSSNEKVAMPLSGSHMLNVFVDLKDKPHLYSADVTAMDSVISDGVFKVIAGLRKKGFENHPAHETISKHIECAIEQTKHAYVINLIGEKLDEFVLPTEYEAIDASTWNALREVSRLPCFIEHETAPGGVLHKQYGGSTGDSNVTFNNTKALPIILMYSFCKANNWDYAEFFDKVPLHNFGDDNLFGLEDEDMLDDVMEIAQRDLGVTLRIESKGTSIFDQQFLGRRPLPVEQFRHEFEQANLPVPEFAIVNDTTVMKMRFANEKIESTRHKGGNHELYRLEKCLGYLNLCAHDREFYDTIVAYMEVVKERIPPEIRREKWFRSKFKVPTYAQILKLWYKPIDLAKVDGVHSLSIRVGLLSKTETALLRITRFLGMICDTFPAHLVAGGECDTLRITNLTSGIFEAHAWHCFVVENERPPSLYELRGMLSDSPFSAFADAYQWLATVGCTLPTKGPLFTRNRNHAIFRLLVYTAVYMNLNRMASNVSSVPLGNVLLDLFNLVMFKSRNLFGSLGYSYYLGKGKTSPVISGLMPKDPYLYHKRAAIIVDQILPKISLLGMFPFADMLEAAAVCSEEFSKLFTTTMFQDVTPALQDVTTNDTPWSNAVTEALAHVVKSRCPMITAHTGTGKTKYTPGLVLRNTVVPTTQVIVVMPRNIICEQWSQTSGALYKRRGVTDTSEMITCTYGYLAHCFAHASIWWDKHAFFLFDEAHEESVEWKYLRSHFVGAHRCICLTATPLATACANYPRIAVDIEAPYNIDTVQYEGGMRDAISAFLPSANRLVVIEPSIRKCKQLADMIKASGYSAKVVHSGDRTIPDGVHIVATSVIEASITIPGADYIIDSGERIINDGGNLKRVPNDVPGMIQRKGRTGRTNDGTYVSLVKPVNRYYEPVPDVTMLLAKHPISEGSSIKVPFEINNGAIERKLEGDCYVKLENPISDTRMRRSVALLHKLKVLTNRGDEERKNYVNLAKGQVVDEFSHLLLICGITDVRELCRYEECLNNLTQAHPHYIADGQIAGSLPTISNWVIRLKDNPDTTWMSARAERTVRHSPGDTHHKN